MTIRRFFQVLYLTYYVLFAVAKMAEFVILDLPNQPSAATQTAVRLCHFVAVVTEPEPGSVICAKVALNQLHSWGIDGNLVGTVIVNWSEYFSTLEPTQIRTQLGCEMMCVVPVGSSACFQALEPGAPVLLTTADPVVASFVEIAYRISADHLVGMKF